MESKLPQRGLKPPTKWVKPIAIKQPTVEGKVGLALPTPILALPTPILKSSQQISASRQHFLRRRSKSVADLRPAQSTKLTTKLEKPKVAPVRVAAKRPALEKNSDENKPKVPKVKIPDWDYKSRFQELQKKQGALQDDLKGWKLKVAAMGDMEKENLTLKQLNENSVKRISELENQRDALAQQNETLAAENTLLNTENQKLQATLNTREKSLMEIQTSYDALQSNNRANTLKMEELASELSALKLKLINFETLTQEQRKELDANEDLRRALHNTIQDLKGNIRVFCRVRPPVSCLEWEKLQCEINFPNDACIEIKKPRESISAFTGKMLEPKQAFSFDKVFAPQASQSEIFEELAQLVQSALDGYHVCVFAYGQTGSGKTFTMQGSATDKGMIPRTIDLIFERINNLSISGWTYSVTASFLEIYNENIHDLLAPNSTETYEVRYNEGRGVTVTNLKIVSIDSAEELTRLMEEAAQNRAVAATDFNEHSSRSHAVTKINLEGRNNASEMTLVGSINLVDLAGSESAKTSAMSRLDETKHINSSLSNLGNVMMALHKKDSHVPYRNSKLTFLLMSCLGGDAKTLMFVNVAPFEECFGESVNALRFAAKVKEVKVAAKRYKNYVQSQSGQLNFNC